MLTGSCVSRIHSCQHRELPHASNDAHIRERTLPNQGSTRGGFTARSADLDQYRVMSIVRLAPPCCWQVNQSPKRSDAVETLVENVLHVDSPSAAVLTVKACRIFQTHREGRAQYHSRFAPNFSCLSPVNVTHTCALDRASYFALMIGTTTGTRIPQQQFN